MKKRSQTMSASLAAILLLGSLSACGDDGDTAEVEVEVADEAAVEPTEVGEALATGEIAAATDVGELNGMSPEDRAPPPDAEGAAPGGARPEGVAGAEGGPTGSAEADLTAAAATLGIAEQELLDALGGPPPDLEVAAGILGLTVDEIESALGLLPTS